MATDKYGIYGLPPIENVSTSSDGLMSKEDKTKLDSIESNANNYVHPAYHPASMITEDTTHRFVSDSEKSAWNNKASSSHNHDDRYFTQAETVERLNAKISTSNIVTSDDSSNSKVPSAGYVKQKFDDINNKLTNNLNQNRIELTNSSYYPSVVCYRSGQVVYFKCSGNLKKAVSANVELVVGTASMTPVAYRPLVDTNIYTLAINNGTIIEVIVKASGEVAFKAPKAIAANQSINVHGTYMTGKSNF